MINCSFSIYNPFSRRFDIVNSRNFKISKYKNIELNVYKTNNIISCSFNINTGDHAGFDVLIAIFGIDFEFCFYDQRHVIEQH